MAVPPIPIKDRKRASDSLSQSDRTSSLSSYEGAGRSRRVYWVFILVFLTIIFFLLLFISSSFIDGTGPVSVPYSLHSELKADYGVDDQNIVLPAVQLGLIMDYLTDLGTPDPQNHYAAIQISLDTLVPTVTPYQILTATLTGQTDVPTPTSSITISGVTSTPQTGNKTPTQIVLPSITHTITPTPTPTLVGWTATPDYVSTTTPTLSKPPSTKPPNTPSNPTQPTSTKKPSIFTPQPPTVTLIPPSPTNPAPTATSLPPTPTIQPATATKPPSTATKPPPTATRRPPTATNRPPTSTPETPYP